jgi:hypothetical protein
MPPRRIDLHLVETEAPSERHAPARPEPAQRAKTSPVGQHFAALRRGLFFMAAAIALIAPMALATRHAEAGMTLMRGWPLDLSVRAQPTPVPAPRAGEER